MTQHVVLKPLFKSALLLFSAFTLTSCGGLLTDRLMSPVVDNLQKQTDVELVCEGAPSFLLMLDSMTAADPDDEAMLINAAKSYTGYIAALNTCTPGSDRLNALGEKGGMYGKRLLSHYINLDGNQQKLDKSLAELDTDDVPGVFWGSVSWLGWIQQQDGSPESIIGINIIKKVMERILALDPSYQDAGAHLFMGSYLASIPTMFGGNPDLAKSHFDQALEMTDRQSLMIHVAYAEKYCRATMNKELHNSLLQEVADFPLDAAPGKILSNQIAKRQAEKLLEDDFFIE